MGLVQLLWNHWRIVSPCWHFPCMCVFVLRTCWRTGTFFAGLTAAFVFCCLALRIHSSLNTHTLTVRVHVRLPASCLLPPCIWQRPSLFLSLSPPPPPPPPPSVIRLFAGSTHRHTPFPLNPENKHGAAAGAGLTPPRPPSRCAPSMVLSWTPVWQEGMWTNIHHFLAPLPVCCCRNERSIECVKRFVECGVLIVEVFLIFYA